MDDWPIQLFKKSPLKQRKYTELLAMIGNVANCDCLDIGADNGVISYLLRKRGGRWISADLDSKTVQAIQSLVHERVYQIDDSPLPFGDNQFDLVVVIDFLEHINNDEGFMREAYRILKPGGKIVLNVPHWKNSWLRKFRLAIGQTDEKHGHLRPGYTLQQLESLLVGRFEMISAKSYSKFFSEFIDMIITLVLDILHKGERSSAKGFVVTRENLGNHRKLFHLYSIAYPIIWAISKLDNLLFWTTGYMLIVLAVKKHEGQ